MNFEHGKDVLITNRYLYLFFACLLDTRSCVVLQSLFNFNSISILFVKNIKITKHSITPKYKRYNKFHWVPRQEDLC